MIMIMIIAVDDDDDNIYKKGPPHTFKRTIQYIYVREPLSQQ